MGNAEKDIAVILERLKQQSEDHAETREAIDKIQSKLDQINEQKIPSVQIQLASVETEITNLKESMSRESKRQGALWGGLSSLGVVLISILVTALISCS